MFLDGIVFLFFPGFSFFFMSFYVVLPGKMYKARLYREKFSFSCSETKAMVELSAKVVERKRTTIEQE